MMKRFLLFGYEAYTPEQPSSAFVGDFDTQDEAEAVMPIKKHEYYDILDTERRVWIEFHQGGACHFIKAGETRPVTYSVYEITEIPSSSDSTGD